MLKNYFLTALRNIKKNALTSVITIAGFSIGIACAHFIFLYVQYELSFDKFLPGHERIYRVLLRAMTFEGGEFLTSGINKDLKNPLLSEDNGIKSFTQFIIADGLLGYDNHFYYEQNNLLLADSSFLDVFNYPLEAGDGKKALEKPMALILSPRMARRYFGHENPLGRVISFKNSLLGETVYYFNVAGILKELPPNSSLQFDFVVNCPLEKLLGYVLAYYKKAYHAQAYRESINFQTQTYVSLKSNSFLPRFQKSLTDAMKSITTQDMRILYRDYQLIAEPLDRIYLFSRVVSPLEKKGNILFILLLSGLGIVVILIACINVVNLTTARALTRVKEIGIRKALGASRGELRAQYLVESVLLSFISLWFAVILIELGLPLFNAMIQRKLAVHYLGNPSYLAAIVGVTFCIGIVSGVYPAFYLSSLDAHGVMKGHRTPRSRTFREIMVVVQFVFSIGLFIASAVILREFRLLKNTDLGLDSKDIVMVRLNIPEIEMRYADIKKAISAVPGVLGVTGSSFAAWEYGERVKDFPLSTFARSRFADVMIVDPDYLRIHKISLLDGRDFNPDGQRGQYELIVNETAQKLLGLKLYSFFYDDPLVGHVVGIAKDFAYLMPFKRIKPLILTTRSPFMINTSYAPAPVHLNYMLIKIRPDDQLKVVQGIETTWKDINPGFAFDSKFVGKEIVRQLDDSNRSFESALDISTILAFLLSGLGLFGLASFEIERRTKEIGIRKALGATSRQIAVHFLLGFLRLIAFANIIAWPLTFLLIRLVFGFIQYPRQLLIGPFIFLEVGALSVVVMVVTVGAQTLRAASSNPVDTLRYE